MSTGLELIPFAIAAGVGVVGRYRARRAEQQALGPPPYSFETRMRDAQLLVGAAAALGASTAGGEPADVTEVVGTPLSLVQNEQGIFEAFFPGSVRQEEAQAAVAHLDGEYTRLVQERVYRQVIERAQREGLALETERVEEDNSIVLTLRVEQP